MTSYVKWGRVGVAAVAAAWSMTAAAGAPGGSIFTTIEASADGRVQSSGVLGQTLFLGEQNIRTSRSGGSNISDGLFEFDLSSLPNGATITGAFLELRTDSLVSNTGPTAEVTFLGFAGNGTLELADESAAATVLEVENFAAGGGGVGNNQNLSFDLSANPFLNSILNDADPNDFVTIRSETINFVTFTVDSLESLDADARPARLFIAYLPEPAALGLLAGLPVLLRRRRV